ncbi:GNAT family N-acetyltransferase [Tateyamaria pelophila]|uniref:GNAT family N-acetyltransferase n=1 Tax=Tateyamaria pelophila TaxID=328415 RepID=UPI001CBD5483|nr:GNAT family N-acetyltransferase [Tateyamaria pelophila]
MESKRAFSILCPIPEPNRQEAAGLFWQAFSDKLDKLMGPKAKAVEFFAHVLDPSHGIAAVDPAGKLLGMAGFKTANGALIGGELSDMCRTYGSFGGLWRGVLLSVLERDLDRDTLLMDGIVVTEQARGHGVGTALLDAVTQQACKLGKLWVRLDVIDSNPRARSLYERRGFVPTGDIKLGPFSRIFGFRKATTMRFDVKTAELRPE